MPELLTGAVMLSILRDLHAVFPGRLTDDDLSRKVSAYHEALRGHDGEDVRWASAQCIREDNYFPKPNRLLELATKRRASQRAIIAPNQDEQRCPSCHARYESVTRYRVAMRRPVSEFEKFPAIMQLTACGKYALLESFSRDLCPDCTQPCQVPCPGILTPVVPVDQLTGYERTAPRERTSVDVRSSEAA